MKHLLLALLTAACIAAAGASHAISFQVDFPILTYPPRPAPETPQDCSGTSADNADVCVVTTN